MSGKSASSLLKTIVLPPASGGPATATLIFAHGLGDTGEQDDGRRFVGLDLNVNLSSGAGWYDVAQMLSRRPSLKHVRFVLPNAPVQPVSLNMGMKVSASA